MGIYRLRMITPPLEEPVLLSDVKMHSRITDTASDSILSSLVKSGRLIAERYQRRAYITQTYDMIFDSFPSLPLAIPCPPLQSILSISYITCSSAVPIVIPSTEYIVDTTSEPGIIAHAYGASWPAVTLRSVSAVTIRFIAGYGNKSADVPEYIRDAILLYVTNREANRAGEGGGIPPQFYDLLSIGRVDNICGEIEDG